MEWHSRGEVYYGSADTRGGVRVKYFTVDRDAFGGSMNGNLLSAGVSYQEIFLPTGGFQRAMVITLRLQLTRATANASVGMLPSGIFYTGYCGAVVQGPALGGSGVQTHAAP